MCDHIVGGATHTFVVSSKLDQFNRTPFSCWKSIVHELLCNMLTRSTTRICKWKAALLDEIGGNAQLMTDMFPLLTTIIGTQPPVLPLPPTEAAHRINMVNTNKNILYIYVY
jgi:predicted ATPase